MISIAIAMIVNLITIAVVIGFQHEVRDKVLGFGSHAFVGSSGSESLFENEPIRKKQVFLSKVRSFHFVKNVQPVAYKPAILQSRKNNTKNNDIQSVLVKGVDGHYDFSFFKQHLKAGRLPDLQTADASFEVLISQQLASNLNYSPGDELSAFFVKSQPVKKLFRVAGIYETGMEDFDRKMVLADIRQIQRLNDWGMQSSIRIADTLLNQYLIVRADVHGGNGNYRYDWGNGYGIYPGFTWYPEHDTVFRLVASDFWLLPNEKGQRNSIPDTAWMKVKVRSKTGINYPIRLNSDQSIYKKFLNKDGTRFRMEAADRIVDCELIDGKGSFENYVGAYEINFKEWDGYESQLNQLKREIEFIPDASGQDLRVTGIREHERETFIWLSFLDINVYIIISLMVVIGIINMGSALLVMILMRTSFIGLLKALGAANGSIRKIFLYQTGRLMLKGMLWGNIIGLGFCLLQDQFQIIPLDPKVYYLNAVPIELNFISVLIINIVTLIICMGAMLIPLMVINRIKPAKAIKFN